MEILRVQTDNGQIRVGRKKRRMLTRDGCNEPCLRRYWCPKKQWLFPHPCPFANRHECGTYERMCGAL